MKSNEMDKKLTAEFEDDFADMAGVLDTTLPDPVLLEMYRRLRKREVVWNDYIDDSTIDIALYIKKVHRSGGHCNLQSISSILKGQCSRSRLKNILFLFIQNFFTKGKAGLIAG